jgi:hypothetical protein
VLNELKVDSDLLTKENWDAVKEADSGYEKWNKPHADLSNNPLVKVDVQQHMD